MKLHVKKSRKSLHIGIANKENNEKERLYLQIMKNNF